MTHESELYLYTLKPVCQIPNGWDLTLVRGVTTRLECVVVSHTKRVPTEVDKWKCDMDVPIMAKREAFIFTDRWCGQSRYQRLLILLNQHNNNV